MAVVTAGMPVPDARLADGCRLRFAVDPRPVRLRALSPPPGWGRPRSRWPPAGSRSAPPSSSPWVCCPQVADGVAVSIPTAGSLISAYALGVVVGAPLLAFFGARLPRRGLLVGLMAAYALFNLASALSTGFVPLLVLRFLDGLPHGAYFGVASLVAAGLAAPGAAGPGGRRGHARAVGGQRGGRPGGDLARPARGLAVGVLRGGGPVRAHRGAGAGLRARVAPRPVGDRAPRARGAGPRRRSGSRC